MFYRPHKRVCLECDPKKDMAHQEFHAECDINKIMKKYGPREMLNVVGTRQPIFGDFTAVDDYQTALEMLSEADELFMELPSGLRARFDNDPQKFIVWFDQASPEDLRDAGLTVEPSTVGEVVSPPPKAAAPASPEGSPDGSSEPPPSS